MRILMVNDDGYASYGIKRLAERLSAEHEVTVIAPAKCNSGMAHAMTFGKPIFLKKIEKYPTECYSLSGTPADCVKFGMEFVKEKIDLVISGINTEPNIGTTVVYSGTAAAAMEASLYKVKAIAVSANPEKESDYEGIIDFFLANFDYYLSLCSENYAINININNHKIGNKGHKFVPKKSGKDSDPEIAEVIEKFVSAVGARCDIKGTLSNGKITIKFRSQQDLERIYGLISGGAELFTE